MNGSRLGRGRVGRLAVSVGSMVVVALLVFLYRTATTEMSRLRELHVQCVHQQEALGAQLQVIFEYKSRLEKSLAEEKKSNTEIKQELEKRADREKSLRDKNSIEAMQKFNSLQQHQKILEVEHQDLKDECEKTQRLALEEKDRLESRLQDLRSQIREKDRIREDKDKMKDANDKSLEELKSKYLELETEKRKIEGKYNDLMKGTGNADGRVEHLNEEIVQLKRDVEEAKASCRASSPSFISDNPKTLQQMIQPSAVQQISPSRQQVSRPSNDNENPQPLQPPRDHQPIGNPSDNAEEKGDEIFNEQNQNPKFELIGGNIVPADPDKVDQVNEGLMNLPVPYSKRGFNGLMKKSVNQGEAPKSEAEVDNDIDDEARQVLPMPNQDKPMKYVDGKHSSKSPKYKSPILKPQIVDTQDHLDEQRRNIESPLKNKDVNDDQKQVAAIPPKTSK